MDFKKVFTSSIGKLTMGSFLGQLITILVSPITTRLYSPDELGIYTLLLTIVNMVGPVLCVKYEMAIVTEKEEKNIYPIILLCFIINFILSTLSIIGYTIYIIYIGAFTKVYYIYISIVYILLLLNGLSNILIFYNNRNKDYDIISKVYVIRIFVQNALLIILGLFKCSVMGLLLAQLLGMFVGIKKQSEKLIPNIKEFKNIKKDDIKYIAKSNKKLAFYTAPANLINTASYSILNFFITALYGTTIFGYYSMSYRMLGIPLTLVSRNVSQVFFEKATAEYKKNNNFTNVLLKMTVGLSVVSIIMVIGLEILAPWAFRIFFGEGWEISGKYVQILVWMFGLRLIVSALTPALVIIKRQDIELKMQCMFIAFSIITYITSELYTLPIELFLILITFSYSLIYIIMYIVIYKKSGKKENLNEKS